jgi:steroid delta-isomerase-like uncharacterized protein
MPAAAPPSGALQVTHSEEAALLRKLAFLMALVAVPAVAVAGSAKENKALVLRFYEEGVNQGRLDLFDHLLADNFVEREEMPGMEPNREGVKQWFAGMRAAFPDLKFDVHFTMTDGDKVAAYLTMSGTQAAEFMGMPSQGRAFSVKTVDIVRFENGKVAEHWGVTDTGAMMQQLAGEGAAEE